jgi:UDP-glucose 4-epimerase
MEWLSMLISVLVTGGAGFIGSHLAEELFNIGYRVVVLDDLSGGKVSNIIAALPARHVNDGAGIYFVRGSILDVELLEKLFEEFKFTYVYHLAAYAAEGLSHFIKRFNYTNNVIGSVNLINASVNHGVKCFVFTSSMAVYGSAKPPMTEDMTPQPEDSYGIAKWTIEQELKISRELFGLDYVIFRPHNVIGPRQNIADKYRNVVGIFMSQIMRGEPMTIFGSGEQTRAFSPVEDIVPIIARSPCAPTALANTFNIGAGRAISINQLAQRVAYVMGVEANVVHLDTRHEVQEAFCSHDKITKVFGQQKETPLGEALTRMAAWVKSQAICSPTPFNNIEILKNLPPSWRPE